MTLFLPLLGTYYCTHSWQFFGVIYSHFTTLEPCITFLIKTYTTSPFFNFLQSSNLTNPLELSLKPRSRVYPFCSVDSTTTCKNIHFVAVSILRVLFSTFGSSVNYFSYSIRQCSFFCHHFRQGLMRQRTDKRSNLKLIFCCYGKTEMKYILSFF